MLGNLIEYYLIAEEENREFYRRECLRFSEWALKMLESGYDFPALHTAAGGFDMITPPTAKHCFKDVVKELMNTKIINADLAFTVIMEEYERGLFSGAAELLYYKPWIGQRLSFPYSIEYDQHKDEYYAVQNSALRYSVLEEFTREFLAKAGYSVK